MDFRQFVTDHLARLGDDDPTSVFGTEAQMLLDISRQQDLDERAEYSTQESDASNEVMDVDELAEDPSSLTTRSEPAMDSAISIQPESIPELNTSDQAEVEQPQDQSVSPDAVPEQFMQGTHTLDAELADSGSFNSSPDAESHNVLPVSDQLTAETADLNTVDSGEGATLSDFLQERGEDATTNEAVAMGSQAEAVAENPVSDQTGPPTEPSESIEFGSSPEAIPEQFLEPVSASDAEATPLIDLPRSEEASVNRTSEIVHVPEHLRAEFSNILSHADEKIHMSGLQTSVTEPGVELPPLPAIPPEITDRGSVVHAQSHALMERERL